MSITFAVITQMPRTASLRWGDLISPRAMYEFTIMDAVGALPTLLAMAGVLIGCVLVLYLLKKLLEFILIPGERHQKYVLHTIEKKTDGKIHKIWKKAEVHHIGSVLHLILETFFFVGLIVAALFAAAIGNVNIWESAIASVGIGIIGTYIFGPGLQQVGSGYFFFLNSAMSVGEYWELVGGGGVGGRVCRITAFFVEFMALGPDGHGVLHRVSMTTIMSGNWIRNFYKEAQELIVVMDEVVVVTPQKASAAAEEIAFDIDEAYDDDDDDDHLKRA